MNGLIVHKHLNSSSAYELADRLCERMYYGKTVIIVDNPKGFIGPLRKAWLKLIRQKELERARTLNAAKIAEIGGTVSYMKLLRFTTYYPPGEYPGDVYLAGVKGALAWPPECSTMYIVGKTERHERYLLTSWMPRCSHVVIYERPD